MKRTITVLIVIVILFASFLPVATANEDPNNHILTADDILGSDHFEPLTGKSILVIPQSQMVSLTKKPRPLSTRRLITPYHRFLLQPRGILILPLITAIQPQRYTGMLNLSIM